MGAAKSSSLVFLGPSQSAALGQHPTLTGVGGLGEKVPRLAGRRGGWVPVPFPLTL